MVSNSSGVRRARSRRCGKRRCQCQKCCASSLKSGKRYLVLEKVAGRALLRSDIAHPARISWRRAEKILHLLQPLLARIHSAGRVWRDCKPSHMFVQGKQVRLVDFEGACRIEESDVLPWGVLPYMPPIYRGKFLPRRAGPKEDNYALGVIAFQFRAGQFPPGSARLRARIYGHAQCPGSLRTRIESLLRAGC